MKRRIRIFAILFLLIVAFCACDESYYGTSYRSSYTTKHTAYSYPVNFGGCTQIKTTKTKIKYHPVYGVKKTKTTRRTTIC